MNLFHQINSPLALAYLELLIVVLGMEMPVYVSVPKNYGIDVVRLELLSAG